MVNANLLESAPGFSDVLAHYGRKIADFVLPPACQICGGEIMENGGLCPTCWGQLRFIGAPLCHICGMPFETAPHLSRFEPEHLRCGPCLIRQPKVLQARQALVYDDASSQLILPFKHADRTEMAPLLTSFLRRIGETFFKETDLIVPVPLHYQRLVLRRYNQAALLSRLLSRHYLIRHGADVLKRTRRTPSQGHLTLRQRKANVRNAFAINPAWNISGLRILLIDDVLTTGATLESCAAVLYKAEAAEVRALALARVVRPSSVS